jgi:hypothetical protein
MSAYGNLDPLRKQHIWAKRIQLFLDIVEQKNDPRIHDFFDDLILRRKVVIKTAGLDLDTVGYLSHRAGIISLVDDQPGSRVQDLAASCV